MLASEASFDANSETLDIARAVPVSGTYNIAHPMGLVWSMTPVSDAPQQNGSAIQRAEPWALTLSGDVEGDEMPPVTVTREYAAAGVTRTELRKDGLVASVFRPGRLGPRPVVITFTGSDGGLNEMPSALLASHGFVGMSLAFFGVDPLPQYLESFPLEYFDKAYRWLAQQPFVDPDAIVVTGASRGGELSLLLGATFPWVRAVMAIAPSGLVYRGVTNRTTEPTSAWSLGGEPLPFARSDRSVLDMTAPAIRLAPSFLKGLEDKSMIREAEIAVERTNGPILMISGGDDQMWASQTLTDFAVRRLERSNFKHGFEHIVYPEAGHTIRPPYQPAVTSGYHPVLGVVYAFGGTQAANALAGEDAWRRQLEFLTSVFGR